MTRLKLQTTWLVAAIIAVGIADTSVWWLSGSERRTEIPSLPPFDPKRADTIRIGRIDDPMVLTRTPSDVRAPWRLADSQLEADPIEVDALLADLADGVRGLLAVEANPEQLERYGLSGGRELRVDIEALGAPLSALYIGSDIGGGLTWIRLPDDDRVIQAKIGGRARYDRTPSSLRDRRLSSIDAASVDSIELRSGEVRLRATRSGESWRGEPFAVDASTIDELVRALAALRAVEMTDQDQGIDWSLATVTLESSAGAIDLQFGRAETNRYARRIGAPGIGRIRLPWVDKLADPHTFGDRALWRVDRIDRFTLLAPGRDGLLERTGDDYVIRRPAQIDIDPNQLSAILSFLSHPRVLSWSTPPDRFDKTHIWTLQTDQGTLAMELGAIDGDRIAVRTGDRAGWLDIRAVKTVEALFGG